MPLSTETIAAFIAATMVLTMTPGPSVLLGVVHAVQHGARKTVYTALGDISANFLQMVLVAVGLGAVIASSGAAFNAIKWFGVATLAYMGLKMVLSPCQSGQEMTQATSASPWMLYRSGFLVAAGNPKAIVFFTAFFPQFIDPSQPLWPQMAILCPIMMALDFAWVMAYAASAQRFLKFLRKHPYFLNRTGGGALCSGAVYLALAEKASV